jgi:hypothetical protein
MKTSVFYTLYVVACLSVILWVHTMDSAEHLKKDDHVEWTKPANNAEFMRRQGKINYE